MNNKEIKIYSSQLLLDKSLLAVFKNMAKDLWFSRQLIYQLTLREFKARYKQSLLGWTWIFLMPLITMGTFLLLNISGVIKIGEIPVPYPIFGLLGFSLWQIIANGWPVLTRSITSAQSLVSQINFPREALVISSVGQVVVDFLIRCSLVLFVYFLYGLWPSIWVMLLPILVLPIFILTLGLGFFTALLNILIRDTVNFVTIIMDFFLFLMPIMYTLPEKGFLNQLNRYNPIYFLIEAPRRLIISGKIDNPLSYFLSCVFVLIIFILGWFTFYVSQSKASESL